MTCEVKKSSSMDLCDWAIAGSSFVAGILAGHKINQYREVGPLGKFFVPVFVTSTVLALRDRIRPFICEGDVAQQKINQS